MTRSISPPSSELHSEAAYWYNEKLAGDMTAQDELRFRDWIARSPAHRKAYQTVDRGWNIAGLTEKDIHGAKEDVSTQKRSIWHSRFAVAAALLLAFTLSYGAIPGYIDGNAELTVQSFQTTTGQRSKITLPDGTRVTLDSETELKFTDLNNERSVQMVQGRAFFNVAKNAERPFVVHANGKTVRALGTAFEVSLDGNEVAVVLAEGKVRVEEARSKGSADMMPGRQLVMRSDRQWTLSNVDVKKETSWTSGRLIFMNDPLSQAISEVNRYSTKKLVFENGSTPPTDIVGIFSAGDVDGFVKALELNGIAKKVSSSDNQIVLAAQDRS